jgi:hypothetical protein
MHIARPGETVASLFGAPSPSLAVRCRRCERRTSLDLVDLQAHERDRREVVRLPVICRCGTTAIEWVVLESPGEVEAFMSGRAAPPLPGSIDGAGSPGD